MNFHSFLPFGVKHLKLIEFAINLFSSTIEFTVVEIIRKAKSWSEHESLDQTSEAAYHVDDARTSVIVIFQN